MRFVVKVSRKGQVVIPIEIRRRYNIKDKVVIKVDEEGIKIIPLMSLKEMFGTDGEMMKIIAKEIVEERMEEIKREE
ncbi:MAG: AbrB family transcriptional regulator [Thermoprotei archaeon]|nr:MAG: AbrB family transcriptional regulator [Thermoprotei archaeon]